MAVDQTEVFISWLDGEEKKKNWTDYELAKSAGISHSVISRARQGILPKWEACEKIANAFGVPPILAYQKAGLLDTDPNTDPWVEEQKYKLKQIPPEMRPMAARVIEGFVEESQEERSLARSRKTKPVKS
ncbi:MAG TPA: hypothetical protein DCS05_04340 [Nitrospiraceae bacterium]|nr:hypothetical protein [Nitrospiraceae bacterium]